MRTRYSIAALLVACLVGCGEPSCPDGGDCSPGDAGGGDAGSGRDARPEQCAADRDCSDGDFCSGVERCVIGDPAADLRGCVPGTAPCLDDQVCDSGMATCVTDCSVGDADGDGERAIECGGSDCDDSDPGRYPGNTEVCDDRDQDCVDETLAPASGDGDDDGFVSNLCCAPGDDGPVCGRDCNDEAGGINPGSPEACNGVDDDCDGLTDEGLTSLFYRDADGDLYGLESDSVVACRRPDGYATVPGDCDDDELMINPLGSETCDGVDQDCDTMTDEEAEELGSREHCGACFNECQFACGGASCDLPVEVEVGGQQACARLASGTTFCWGRNDSGQLGLGDVTDRTRPTLLPSTGPVTAIGLGGEHSCFVIEGQVRCAGANDIEQLGVAGGGSPDLVTSRTGGGAGYADVVASEETTCALFGTGVSCWGRALHAPAMSASYAVDEVGGDRLVAGAVSLGNSFACALRTDGTVGCWGSDDVAQLARGSVGAPSAQVVSSVLPGAIAQVVSAAGALRGGSHGCVLTEAGSLICWGLNRDGQVGVGSASTVVPVPTTVPGVWAGVSAGDRTTCAWDAAGAGYCWGRNNGHVGDGTALDRDAPTAVLGGHLWTQLEVGSDMTCGIRNDSVVMCWGQNTHGTAGNGEFGGREAFPSLVVPPSP